MFSMFAPTSPKEPSLKEIMAHLESDHPDDVLDRQLSFGRDQRSRHHNTYLLLALAWNQQKAASRLLMLDTEKAALNLADEWPTCLNTPLILAAKIHATNLVQQLIQLGAEVDHQDYRGYTALHYACLLRDEASIVCLLEAGASTHIKNAFGHLPADYYAMTIVPADLRYRYGSQDEMLIHVADSNNRYFATEKKCLSAFRWYIAHIIVNMNLGHDVQWQGHPVYKWAGILLTRQSPVFDADLYVLMMQLYCDNRPVLHRVLHDRLQADPVYMNAYNEEKFDRYRLHVFDCISPSSFTRKENGEQWIELQAMSLKNPVPSSSGHP